MPHFIFAYHGGKRPENDAEIAAEMARWESWFDSIGGSVIDPGNPVGLSKTVSADGVVDHGGANPISGYTIIYAPDMDGAIEVARACPIMGSGTIEVAEIHAFPSGDDQHG